MTLTDDTCGFLDVSSALEVAEHWVSEATKALLRLMSTNFP